MFFHCPFHISFAPCKHLSWLWLFSWWGDPEGRSWRVWPLAGLPGLGCCHFPGTPHSGALDLTSWATKQDLMKRSGNLGDEYPWYESWPVGSEVKGAGRTTPPFSLLQISLRRGPSLQACWRSSTGWAHSAAKHQLPLGGVSGTDHVSFSVPASLLLSRLHCPVLDLPNVLVP